MPEACVFCSIVAGTTPHEVIGESDKALAFMTALVPNWQQPQAAEDEIAEAAQRLRAVWADG